jgi:hypothetical protein
MKTMFQLTQYRRNHKGSYDEKDSGTMTIIGSRPKHDPYVVIRCWHGEEYQLADRRQLKTFAKNLLKALSK